VWKLLVKIERRNWRHWIWGNFEIEIFEIEEKKKLNWHISEIGNVAWIINEWRSWKDERFLTTRPTGVNHLTQLRVSFLSPVFSASLHCSRPSLIHLTVRQIVAPADQQFLDVRPICMWFVSSDACDRVPQQENVTRGFTGYTYSAFCERHTFITINTICSTWHSYILADLTPLMLSFVLFWL